MLFVGIMFVVIHYTYEKCQKWHFFVIKKKSMLPEETPNQNQEAPATPVDGGESEEQKEFNKLFEGIDLDDENADIEELKSQVENIKKGAAKFFSEKGMKKNEKKEEPKPAIKQEDASDLEVIFFEGKPESKLVEDDLKAIAKAKGISVIQAWKNESWIQEKAKTLHAEKVEKEKNEGRIGDPSENIEIGKDAATKALENSFISNLPKGFSAATPKY